MTKNISIVVPSIRPENLNKFYDFTEKACRKYTFELVIPSPYILPEQILKKKNVKFLHTYANPTLAFQMASNLCDADFIYNTTDDGLIQENTIDEALDLFYKNIINPLDLINMRYDEAVLDRDTLELLSTNHKHFPLSYWEAHSYYEFSRFQCVKPWFKTCPHFLMSLKYFQQLGGFDCNYEYSNHALHDLAFRAQENGSVVVNSPSVAFYCSHGHSDHKPIEDAQLGPDLFRFNQIYGNLSSLKDRVFLKYDDWKGRPDIWSRRFDENNLKINK